jgi:Cu/Ag efflux pump CusA
LRSNSVTLTELIESTGNALWVSPLSFVEASTPGTGGFVETPNQRLGVQHIQPITTSKQLADVALEGEHSNQLRIGDVATVHEDHQPLIGDASVDGAPGLMLVVERFPDADTAEVTREVEAAMAAMAPGLSGIAIDPTVFRPATYLSAALGHLGVAGLVALVGLVAVLAALLLSWRVALIAAVAVPLSVTAAAYVMHLRGHTLTTMTMLGLAAALAVLIDDAVGDVAEIGRRLRAGDAPVASVVKDVVAARRGPLLFAAAVVLLVVFPLLLMGGVSGAFTKPLVLSYALAVAASLVVALVVTPTLAVLLLGNRGRFVRESPLDGWVRRSFDRAVAPSLGHPVPMFVAAVALGVVGVVIASQTVSGQILPPLQDRNVVVRLSAAPGTALAEMNRVTTLVATELGSINGVQLAGAHVGRALIADEVVDVNAAEIWVKLHQDADYSGALQAIHETVRGYPGLRTSVRTYAEDQVAAARVSGGDNLVVRVSGHDLAELQEIADDVSKMLGTISGVLSPEVAPQVSEPTVEIEVDLAKAQRHGLRPGDVRREVSTLISGLTVGSLYEQQKVYDVVVWGGRAARHNLGSLKSILIDTPSGGHVRLGDVAEVRLAPNPVSITHHGVSRSVDVTATVQGRSASDVTQEVTGRLRGIAMPYEYRAEVLQEAASQEVGQRRMALIAFVVALLVFLLLQAATSSWRSAAVLFGCLPLSVLGGVVVAPFVGGIRSIGVLAGLVAVLAVAVRQSLSLVRRAQQLRDVPGSSPMGHGVRGAAREQAPSVVGVALVSAAVLVAPAVMGNIAGLEVLHPFALTVLGGLVSSTLVVLVLVPTFFLVVEGGSARPRTDSAAANSETEVQV